MPATQSLADALDGRYRPGDTKQHILFEGDPFLLRPIMVAASLDWPDKYLGPSADRPEALLPTNPG